MILIETDNERNNLSSALEDEEEGGGNMQTYN